MSFWSLRSVLFESTTLPFFSLCMDSHTEKSTPTVIPPGSTEGLLSTQSISGAVPLENPLSNARLQLPHYHHQMLWQHVAQLAFKVSSKKEDENKLLEKASSSIEVFSHT